MGYIRANLSQGGGFDIINFAIDFLIALIFYGGLTFLISWAVIAAWQRLNRGNVGNAP